MMGSQLEVWSQLGKGSRFWLDVALPMVEVEEMDLQQSDRLIIGFQGSPRKILVIDDKQENRSVLANLLEPLGFQVAEAADGHTGILLALQMQPDLIFMDLVMPVMNGFEATRQLRQRPEFASLQQVIIIATSASAFDQDQQQSLNAGCNGFLPKPIRSTVLFQLLQQHLNLEWIYEPESPSLRTQNDSNSSLAATETTTFPASSLHSLSVDELPKSVVEAIATLDNLVMVGDIQGILEKLDQIAVSDSAAPQWNALAEQIRHLANSFQIKKLQNILRDLRAIDENG
jgi:CheY-like chemotaxis protein